MAKVYILGQMVENMKEIIFKIKKKDMASIIGYLKIIINKIRLMEENTKEIGKMENKTDMDSIQEKMEF
jgi:hypothetical protein